MLKCVHPELEFIPLFAGRLAVIPGGGEHQVAEALAVRWADPIRSIGLLSWFNMHGWTIIRTS